MTSDQLFWLDPWSAAGPDGLGQAAAQAHDLRLHAEQRHRSAGPGAPRQSQLAEPDALTAMDLGARRLDLIGLKFQLAQEIAAAYAQALAAAARQGAKHLPPTHLLSEISGDNGRCQDLRDAYSALKSEYSQVWLSENRPYWLNNVTVRYDLEIERWQRRGDQFAAAIRAWQNGQDLPAAAALGLPAPAATGALSRFGGSPDTVE